MKPLLGATAISVEASDEQLVEWARTGNSEAFAVLFRRYRPAIARYAGRIMGDDVRAEDIVQEVFLSALRSIASLDRPAGFKPWLYRIAHNTCVDHMRRNHRAEEVSMDTALLAPSDEIRLFRQAPSTHAAVTLKEDFKHLREAFGGLPPTQSVMLVMRELQGLSYDEIALRLGVTRASVESTLFRARQGLRDEYGQISTGERCLRMRPVMARMAEGMSGLRDKRALARHLRGCQWCRREAYAMGLAGAAVESSSGLRKGLARVAALLPMPWLIHRRADETDAASSAGGSGGSLAVQAQTAVTHLSASMGIGADQAATAIHKAVAVVAAVAVVGGGGLVASKGQSTLGLLPKPASGPASTRAVGPAGVPPLPIRSGAREASDPAAIAAAPGAQAQGNAATAPLLPTAPSGVPGPIDTLGVPEAVAPPKAPIDPPPGEVPLEAEVQSSTPATEPSLPAAGETGSTVPAPDSGTEGGVAPVADGTGDPGSDVVVPPDGVTPLPDPPACDVLPDLATTCPGLESATDQAPPVSS